MTDSGSYTFDKPANMDDKMTGNELPNDLKPVDEEELLQDKLNEWIERVNWLNEELEIATAKVKFYEKAIKSYNKAFKK